MKNIVLLLSIFLMGGAMQAQTVYSDLIINEIMQSNIDCLVDDINQFPDSWVELYNPTNQIIDLGGYRLGDSPNPAKAYILVSGYKIGPGAHHVVYCDKEGVNHHADFRLDSGKGSIYLFKGEEVIDKIEKFAAQPAPNVAYGREFDGADTWGYQLVPSPNAPNEGGITTVVLGEPVFSTPGRVANDPVTLTLSIPSDSPEGTVIRYTLDGSEPTEQSAAYTGAIKISDNTVVRAKLMCKGAISPRSTTHSYIFHYQDMTLPIISIVTNEEFLYSDNLGILSSYKQDGELENYMHHWRRPMNLEYFTAEGKKAVINQLGETKVKGNDTRHYLIKSMILYANKRFGTKRFKYEFFPDQKPGIDEYKALEIRNAGNDCYRAYLRDALAQRMMGEYADLDWQAWQPTVVYINGKYEGILNLRERSDENYVEANYDGLEDIDMIENWKMVEEGSIDSFLEFKDFYTETGHTYEEYSKWMDLEEFANYFILNIYYCNIDFPGNNCMMWRPKAEGGRWRWLCKDLDDALGNIGISHDVDFLDLLYNPEKYDGLNWAINEEATRLFRQLMEVPEFREMFLTRYAVYTGDFLRPDNTIAKMEEMAEILAPEWPKHYEKNTLHWASQETFMNQIASFVINRDLVVHRQVADFLGLGRPVSVNVRNTDALVGKLVMGGIPLSMDSFIGKIFLGMPVTISATDFSDDFGGWEVAYNSTTGKSEKRYVADREFTFVSTDVKVITIKPVDKATFTAGIDDVIADEADEEPRYYDLQGLPVDASELTKGIYIRRTGTTTQKVVI